MLTRLFLLVALAIGLGACQQGAAPDQPDPSPILFEIRDLEGKPEGWLFGTIHKLPDGTQWRTDRLEQATARADLLIVEIADLTDRKRMSAIFNRLAASPDLAPLPLRVAEAQRADLRAMMRDTDFTPEQFQAVETWAAALMLAQAADTGESGNGVDRAMLRDFADRPIREFEGPEKQLRIFDGLPQQDQRDLLLGVVDEYQKQKDYPAALRNAWIAGDEAKLIAATESGIMADAELRDALIVTRNRDWVEQLVPMLEGDQLPFVAVGAGHLVGPDGLPAMLTAQGFTVERIQ